MKNGRLKQARKMITPEEFELFQKKQERQKIDPIGSLEEKRAELKRELETTVNSLIKTKILATLEASERSLISLRELKEQEETLIQFREAEDVDLREVALAAGPLLSQKFLWKLRAAAGGLKTLLKKLSKIYDSFLGISLMILAFLWIGFFSIFSGLILNLFLLTVTSIFFFILWGTTNRGKRKKIISIIFFLLITLNTLIFAVAPTDGYLGIVRRESVPIRIIDSSAVWFMEPINLRMDDRIEWVDIANIKASHLKDTEYRIFHYWRNRLIGHFFGKDVVIFIEGQRRVNSESTAILLEALKNGRLVQEFQEDLEGKIDRFLENLAAQFTANPNTDLNSIDLKTLDFSNELFRFIPERVSMSFQ